MDNKLQKTDNALLHDAKIIIESAKSYAYSAVNVAMVIPAIGCLENELQRRNFKAKTVNIERSLQINQKH